MTTVDYIVASLDATSSCKTLPMTDLSFSDPLHFVAELITEYPIQTEPNAGNSSYPWLDWEKANKSVEIVGL